MKIGEWWTSVPRATKMTFLRRVTMFVVAFDAAKNSASRCRNGGVVAGGESGMTVQWLFGHDQDL